MYIWEFDNTIDNLDDWCKKYNGTYVWFNDEPQYVQIGIQSSVIGQTAFGKHIIPDEGVKLAPFFPKSQWVKLDKGLSFLRRCPTRQYQRSFNKNCYSLDKPQFNLFGADWSIKYIVTALNKTDNVPFAEAVKQEDSVVLSDQLAYLVTSKKAFSICGPKGILCLGNKVTRKLWTFPDVKPIISGIVGEEEWKINCLNHL